MRYKNISDQDLTVIGVGIVKAGADVEVAEPINNQNFALVKQPAKPEPKKEKAEDNA
ncbi:MAG: hypothetical protein WC530_09845 [Candidatus Omnitrophota bacterium]|jgi:hypothetical protein